MRSPLRCPLSRIIPFSNGTLFLVLFARRVEDLVSRTPSGSGRLLAGGGPSRTRGSATRPRPSLSWRLCLSPFSSRLPRWRRAQLRLTAPSRRPLGPTPPPKRSVFIIIPVSFLFKLFYLSLCCPLQGVRDAVPSTSASSHHH